MFGDNKIHKQIPMKMETGSVISAFTSGPVISWFCTRGRKAELKSGEYGDWTMDSTCNELVMDNSSINYHYCHLPKLVVAIKIRPASKLDTIKSQTEVHFA